MLLFTYIKENFCLDPTIPRKLPTVPRKGYCSAKDLLSRERGTIPRKLLEKKKDTRQSTKCAPYSAFPEPT